MRFIHPFSKECSSGYADEPWLVIRLTIFKFTLVGIWLPAEVDTFTFVLCGFGIQIG